MSIICSIRLFERLANLQNGFFTGADVAAEYAAWTGLRAKLLAAPRFLPDGRVTEYVIRFVDRVEFVAAHGNVQ